MSEEQLKAFIEKVKGDTTLQAKLKAAADSDAVLAIAKEAGFSISADDLKNAQSEVSEEELEGVAGGVGGCRHCYVGMWSQGFSIHDPRDPLRFKGDSPLNQ